MKRYSTGRGRGRKTSFKKRGFKRSIGHHFGRRGRRGKTRRSNTYFVNRGGIRL